MTLLQPCPPAPVTCSSRCWAVACVELELASGALPNSQVRLTLLARTHLVCLHGNRNVPMAKLEKAVDLLDICDESGSLSLAQSP